MTLDAAETVLGIFLDLIGSFIEILNNRNRNGTGNCRKKEIFKQS
jgi:hypothetical protein